MQEFLKYKFFHNTVEHWLISFAILAASILFARLLYRLVNFALKQITIRTSTKLDDIILEQIQRPAILSIILSGLWFSLERLHFTNKIDNAIHRAFILLIAVVLTWAFARVVNAIIKEILIPYSRRDDNKLDEQLIGLIQQVVRIFLWTLGIVVGLNNAGFDVGALIAGLGIGGLALALASQDTVKNMFGGVILFLDKPFKIGDRVLIDGFDGTISEIGIRSTRMKTMEGRLVTIPNAYFSEKPIQNFTQGAHFRVVNLLGLVYNTTPEKMQEAISILQDISRENREYMAEDALIFFEQFGTHSLDIKFIYCIQPERDVFKIRSDINFQILQRFKQAGLEFAFPTRTVLIHRDEG
jgi:MscS family membrane protein